MKLKTSELQGSALDWAVAKCEVGDAINEIDDPHFYSTDWALAGPIIERENINVFMDDEKSGRRMQATPYPRTSTALAKTPTGMTETKVAHS
jgi:hypothetical protein